MALFTAIPANASASPFPFQPDLDARLQTAQHLMPHLQPMQHVGAILDRARLLAAPQAVFLGQPRHLGRAMTFCLDAVSRGATLQDVQRMGQYAKDRLNAGYVRLTQRADGYTVLELPVAQSRDVFLDGNRAVLVGGRIMLGPMFTEPGSAVLDLDHPDSHHVLMVAPLMEKTMLLRALWYQLVRQHCPSALRFVVIDPRGTLPASLQHSAHLVCAPIQSDPENGHLLPFEVRHTLEMLAHEIHRRQTGGGLHPRLVVVITEVADLLKHPSLLSLLNHIIEQGRGVRVHVIAGTAEVTSSTLQHRLIRGSFKARLVGQMADAAQSALACDGEGFFCDWALGNGDITYTLTRQRFQCGIVSDGELRFLPRALELPDIWHLAAATTAATTTATAATSP